MKNKRILKAKTFDSNPKAALFFELLNTLESISDLKSLLSPLDLENIRQIKGEKGDTPIKYVDYFTEDEINSIGRQILDLATPMKGRDYFSPEEISDFLRAATPVKGRDYRDGIDAYTPVKGKDYFDGEDGRDGTEITKEQLIEKINSLDGDIDWKVLKGEPDFDKFIDRLNDPKNKKKLGKQAIDMSDMRWHGGGLSRVFHDDTLTGDGTALNPLSVVGGGGAADLTIEQVTAVQAGSNVEIDLAQLSNPFVSVTLVTDNGQVINPNGRYSIAGNTLTVINAFDTDEWLVQYTY